MLLTSSETLGGEVTGEGRAVGHAPWMSPAISDQLILGQSLTVFGKTLPETLGKSPQCLAHPVSEGDFLAASGLYRPAVSH